MSPNIIDAIINLVNNANVQVSGGGTGTNRINNMGEGFEAYIKSLFANTFNVSAADKKRMLNNAFSYLGSKNYSPDAMLRGGDAIEIKKIESFNADIALNSSHPKRKLCKSDSRVAKACKNARNDDDWNERDIIYAVGYIPKGTSKLKMLGMVYGTEYCASSEIYTGIFQAVKEKIHEIPDFEFTETNELAHMTGVDPLERTFWRARSMWGIKNPWVAFKDVYTYDDKKTFSLMCIISNQKWDSFQNKDLLIVLSQNDDRLSISDVDVQNPDNAADLISAKIITFNI